MGFESDRAAGGQHAHISERWKCKSTCTDEWTLEERVSSHRFVDVERGGERKHTSGHRENGIGARRRVDDKHRIVQGRFRCRLAALLDCSLALAQWRNGGCAPRQPPSLMMSCSSLLFPLSCLFSDTLRQALLSSPPRIRGISIHAASGVCSRYVRSSS